PPLPSSISLLTRRPPASPLLPYTTLFRSPLRLRFRLASRCRDISHSPQRLDGGRGDHVGGESPVLEGVRVPSQVDRLERLIRTVVREQGTCARQQRERPAHLDAVVRFQLHQDAVHVVARPVGGGQGGSSPLRRLVRTGMSGGGRRVLRRLRESAVGVIERAAYSVCQGRASKCDALGVRLKRQLSQLPCGSEFEQCT